MTRKVTKAFEAWDPTIGMTVVINAGVVLAEIHIVFDRTVGPGSPPLRRAVEFQCGGILYCAGFERFDENTAAMDSFLVKLT